MPATTIFDNPYKNIETWSAQGAVIEWGTGGTAMSPVPLVMTSLSIRYQQTNSPQYPINVIGSTNGTRINLKGAPNGTLQIGSIYSPDTDGLQAFIKAVSKSCKTTTDQVTLEITPFGLLDCDKQMTPTKFSLYGVELVSLDFSLQGGEVALITLPTTYTFTSMDWSI